MHIHAYIPTNIHVTPLLKILLSYLSRALERLFLNLVLCQSGTQVLTRHQSTHETHRLYCYIAQMSTRYSVLLHKVIAVWISTRFQSFSMTCRSSKYILPLRCLEKAISELRPLSQGPRMMLKRPHLILSVLFAVIGSKKNPAVLPCQTLRMGWLEPP